MDIDTRIARLTGKDAKPITARQCAATLPEITEAKPKFIPEIQSALQQTDFSGYPNSMRPLAMNNIAAVL